MKAYQLVGIEVAMHLLRPGAKWEITNGEFTHWEDPRPKPTWQEVLDAIEKLRALEDSINTVLLPEQQEAFDKHLAAIEAELYQ